MFSVPKPEIAPARVFPGGEVSELTPEQEFHIGDTPVEVLTPNEKLYIGDPPAKL